MRLLKILFTLAVYLLFSWVAKAQPKNGFAIKAEALNWNNFMLWNSNIPDWEQSKADLMSPAQTFSVRVTRIQKIGRQNKGQQIQYGMSLFYQNCSYEKPWMNTTFPHIYTEYLSNTMQLFTGLNFSYRKEFLFTKPTRSKLRPFVEPEIIASYGIYQHHMFSDSFTDEGVRTEPIDASNYLMLTANLNVGVGIYLDRKLRKAISIYLPLGYTYTLSQELASFSYFGFVGLSYSWLR